MCFLEQKAQTKNGTSPLVQRDRPMAAGCAKNRSRMSYNLIFFHLLRQGEGEKCMTHARAPLASQNPGQHMGVLTARDMTYGDHLRGSPRHGVSLDTKTSRVHLSYPAWKRFGGVNAMA
ncbi:hypothetical protein EVAR_78885_1 [Eumeta japonica]|uniref:Uncharacterized protein n=1 Tax=Eumeta variegata TaxID=151549 RepID=A0A4C1U2M9_EUMVA|nr:hypothetical protein EVAR_78885_1 [Eumeta japonica]